MATKSILKNIDIKKKSDSRNLINALEKAEEKKEENREKRTKISKSFAELRGEKIKELLSNKE